MGNIILNKETIAKYNFDHKRSRVMRVYNNHSIGSMFLGKDTEIKKHIVTAADPQWVDTAAYNKLWNEIENRRKLVLNKFGSPDEMKRNISHMPADASDFFDLIRLDITRRIMEKGDVTPFLCTVLTSDAFTNPTSVQWLLDYVAPFLEFTGNGDPVNLVQIKTGSKDSVSFTLRGVGFEMDLYNELFNDIFSMQKVNEAVARGYILRKNNNVLAPIFDFSFGAVKSVVADTTGSLEDNYYTTLQRAITTLGQLKDFQTKQEIDVSSGLMLICHSTRVRGINRAINGQLQNGSQVRNLSAISEITRILPYNQVTHSYGNTTITYKGCSRDYAYLCLPKETYWYLIKRDLTHKTGPGDTFGLSSQRDAWYFCDSLYNDQFLGGDSTDDATSDTAIAQEHGYIVKVALPDDEEANT